MATRWWVKNNWTYTIGMAFIVLNIVFYLRLMQASDKVVINAMINMDETLAKQNMTSDNANEIIS